MTNYIGGQVVYTVKELIEELQCFNDDQLVLVSGIIDGKYFIAPFYKIEETADEKEIILSTGGNLWTSKH